MRVSSAAIKKFVNFWHNAVLLIGREGPLSTTPGRRAVLRLLSRLFLVRPMGGLKLPSRRSLPVALILAPSWQ